MLKKKMIPTRPLCFISLLKNTVRGEPVEDRVQPMVGDLLMNKSVRPELVEG
jgi:hypothetical protein